MQKVKAILKLTGLLAVTLAIGCRQAAKKGTGNYATDTATIAAGAAIFNQQCIGCHNFRKDVIGPQLAGITDRQDKDWLVRFIKNPAAVVGSGDAHAKQLVDGYKVIMPSFAALGDKDLESVLAYLHSRPALAKVEKKDTAQGLKDPIPAKIQRSDLSVNLQYLTQFPASSEKGEHPLARITKIGLQPGKDDLFVLDLRGKLYDYQPGQQPKVYFDIAKEKPNFLHEGGLATGFGSFAFHPDFQRNGLMYTTHCERPGSGKADFAYPDSVEVALQWVLTEWHTDHPEAAEFSGTSRELLRINYVSVIHGVQEIMFNPSAKKGSPDYGLLFIGVGDGGSVENDYPQIVHKKDKIWGTVIRIDPAGKNSANGRYGIPASNPFAKDPKALGEIYAMGFRNPHRITWTASGKMLVANIGQKMIEALYQVEAGKDYGWPEREGRFLLHPDIAIDKVFPLTANDSADHYSYPVAEFDHDEGVAISGGQEYTGTTLPQLKGKYFFGDIPSGRLFYVDVATFDPRHDATIKEWSIQLDGKPTTFKEICGKDARIDLHFGRDAHGEMYVMTKYDGKLYKMVPAK